MHLLNYFNYSDYYPLPPDLACKNHVIFLLGLQYDSPMTIGDKLFANVEHISYCLCMENQGPLRIGRTMFVSQLFGYHRFMGTARFRFALFHSIVLVCRLLITDFALSGVVRVGR